MPADFPAPIGEGAGAVINYTDQVRDGTILGGEDAPTADQGKAWALYRRSNGELWQKLRSGDDSLQWIIIGRAPGVSPVAYARSALQAVDSPLYPLSNTWVTNPGYYKSARIAVVGATYAPTDTDVVLTFHVWARASGDIATKIGSFTVTPTALFTPYFSGTVPSTTFDTDRLVDAAQASHFPNVRPSLGSPSNYLVTAHTGAKTDPSFFSWVAPDVITNTLVVQTGHLASSAVGWTPSTPDGTVTGYAVALPNVSGVATFDDLGGADIAVVLAAAAGLGGGGSFMVDATVVFN